MGCCGFSFGRWNELADRAPGMRSWSEEPQTSGNRAFDEYRIETLRRLAEEQRQFQEFLARLRMAKDKAEFDQFMADRHTRPEPSPSQPRA
jgi:hypothetical protein